MKYQLKLISLSLLLLCNGSWVIGPLEVNGIETINSPDTLEYSYILVNKEGNLTVNSKGIEVIGNRYGISTALGSIVTLQPQNSIKISLEGKSKTQGIKSISSELLKILTNSLTLGSKSEQDAFGIIGDSSETEFWAKKNFVETTALNGSARGINVQNSSNSFVRADDFLENSTRGNSKVYGIFGNSSTLELEANENIVVNTTGEEGPTYGVYGGSSTVTIGSNENSPFRTENIYLSTVSENGSAYGII